MSLGAQCTSRARESSGGVNASAAAGPSARMNVPSHAGHVHAASAPSSRTCTFTAASAA